MGLELIVGHEIALTCGSSLQVWALLLAMTMGGLCVGYLIGAVRSPSNPFSASLRLASLVVGMVGIVACFPLTEWTSGLSPVWRATLLSLPSIALPMALLGQMIPLLLKATPDSRPGRVFAVSTLSGVFTAFFFGFILFDAFNASIFLLTIGLTATASGILLDFKGKALHFAVTLAVLLPLSLNFSPEGEHVWVKNNLFGRVTLKDDLEKGTRTLAFNGLPQTSIRLADSCSNLQYVHQTAIMASCYPPGSRSLVLGLGGGTVYNAINELGHEVEACEWNPDIAQAAVQFFGADANGIHIDDARHHIRKLKGVYQFIVLDCFFGESPPWHVLTVETIRKLDKHLSHDGMLVLFFPKGSGKGSLISSMMGNTLFEAGMQVAVLETPLGDNPGQVFVATKEPFSYQTYSPFRHTTCSGRSGYSLRIPFQTLSPVAGTGHFDDDHPLLERLEKPLMIRN